MPTLTPLSTLLNRMDRYQSIEVVEEQYKVRDLDDAIKAMRRVTLFPWTLKKSTVRVFADVLFYPIASDHDELAFYDNDSKQFRLKPDTRNTSIKEFLENPTGRNDTAEVWDSGDKMLGIRYESGNTTNQLLSNAETVADYTASDDADSVALDKVFLKEGTASVRVVVTNAAGVATITNTFTSFSDTNYKRKYQFRWVYLAAAPTSIAMRLRSSAGNYLATTVTTQFSGQAFVAGGWNLIAHDLNLATETGTFVSSTISSEQIILTGAATGTYFLDTSSYKGWELLDYWYYSKFLVATSGATAADQEYFYDSNEAYTTDSKLLADTEWVDVFVYNAMVNTAADEENDRILGHIQNKAKEANNLLFERYPHLKPLMHTSRYFFATDHMAQYYGNTTRDI